MVIVRLLRAAWRKLWAARRASREAAGCQAVARDVAQKQVLMQQLAKTLQDNRESKRR